MNDFKKLQAYKVAFELAIDIFHFTKTMPKNESFGLISQIRNSSRSVCSNLGEGYRKRQYKKHFLSKLSDADMENSETQVWLDFCLSCEYINQDHYQNFMKRSQRVGRLLLGMMNSPDKFLPNSTKQ